MNAYDEIHAKQRQGGTSDLWQISKKTFAWMPGQSSAQTLETFGEFADQVADVGVLVPNCKHSAVIAQGSIRVRDNNILRPRFDASYYYSNTILIFDLSQETSC